MSAVNAGSETPSTPQLANRSFPGWWVRIAIATCLLGIVFLRAIAGYWDMALVNILTLILAFVAGMSLLTWFCFRSSYASQLRYGVLGAIGLAVLVGVGTLKVEAVDGNMVPHFAWRWSPPADSQLGRFEPLASPSGDNAAGGNSAPEDATRVSDYPEFLGPGRENYLPGPNLATDWQTHPPRQLWRHPIGAGWSAFAVVDGKAATMEQRGEEEWVTCYDVLSGKPLWGHAITARHETTLGGIGPRSTPTIYAGKVFALGATGVLRCLDLQTGELLWQDDLLARYGLSPEEELQNIAWGRAASPLIVDDLVVVPAGGKKDRARSLIAYEQESGKVAWEGGDQQVSYASPTLATICGVRQILTVNELTVAGHDPQTGVELWNLPWAGSSSGDASASQPHILSGDRLLISKGYFSGSSLWQLSLADGKWNAEMLWHIPKQLKTKFTNVTVIDGHAYGLSDGLLECVDLATSKRCWKKGRYGHGQLLGVGKLLLITSETGTVSLVAANPEKYEELTSFPALDGQTWNNPALVGHLLLVRNGAEAACYELP